MAKQLIVQEYEEMSAEEENARIAQAAVLLEIPVDEFRSILRGESTFFNKPEGDGNGRCGEDQTEKT